MIVGFTGTSEGITEAQKESLIRVLETLDVKVGHHGDCVGADEVFHELVFWHADVVTHPPDNDYKRAFLGATETRKELPYLVRNHNIVDETQVLVACPNGPERLRSGTWATVRYARKKQRPIYIVWPGGHITTERTEK